jgi:hypothetical protein
MQTGKGVGMITMDDSLRNLYASRTDQPRGMRIPRRRQGHHEEVLRILTTCSPTANRDTSHANH